MLHSPASYVRLEEAITKEHHDTSAILVTNATDISTNSTTEEQETATDELEAITNHLIKQVGQNAIESEQFFLFICLSVFSTNHTARHPCNNQPIKLIVQMQSYNQIKQPTICCTYW